MLKRYSIVAVHETNKGVLNRHLTIHLLTQKFLLIWTNDLPQTETVFERMNIIFTKDEAAWKQNHKLSSKDLRVYDSVSMLLHKLSDLYLWLPHVNI